MQLLYFSGSPDPGPPTDYNVIWLDDESAIEYDCITELGVTSYCIHIMSRTPTLPEEKVQEMLDFAYGLDLNPNGVVYMQGNHTGCWD